MSHTKALAKPNLGAKFTAIASMDPFQFLPLLILGTLDYIRDV